MNGIKLLEPAVKRSSHLLTFTSPGNAKNSKLKLSESTIYGRTSRSFKLSLFAKPKKKGFETFTKKIQRMETARKGTENTQTRN